MAGRTWCKIDDVRNALNWAFSAGGDIFVGVALTVAVIPLWREAGAGIPGDRMDITDAMRMKLEPCGAACVGAGFTRIPES